MIAVRNESNLPLRVLGAADTMATIAMMLNRMKVFIFVENYELDPKSFEILYYIPMRICIALSDSCFI